MNLQQIQEEILGYARELGLEPFKTIFELIDFDQMNQIASYGGFPTRYPHWRFGMEYEELRKGYTYGLQKIYELVINNDPCYAYLMKANTLTDQKMVIAHVYAHSDFFRNNLWFSQSNRRMIDEMANHGTTIRRYIERYGQERVEDFLNCALSLENLIYYHSLFLPQPHKTGHVLDEEEEEEPLPRRFKSKDYLDRFINPPEYLRLQKTRLDQERERRKRFPEEPQRDVLLFLIEEAPLENWQRSILSFVREEAYYFAPQALTKIMNEGWATYWHSKIMTEKCLTDPEVIDYADHHSATLGGKLSTLNPYKLGFELFRHIEERWDKGRFGREYELCTDVKLKANWDLKLGKGREKIFQVRSVYNDITFIDDFLTPEFCEEHKLFVYRYNPTSQRYEIADRDFSAIKRHLLFRLTNMGHPIISVVDANYRNRAELLLCHQHEGVDLKIQETLDTLTNLYLIWKRPVHIATVVDGTHKLFTYDGQQHHEQELNAPIC